MSDQEYGKIEQAAPRDADDGQDIDERMMRQTLGLDGKGRRQQPVSVNPKPRHRFVQDGDVPVIHLNTLRDGDGAGVARGRIAALEAALLAEQSARAKAEQSVQSALFQLHAAETKLAHAELAGQEALAAERQLRQRADLALHEALAARDSGAEQAKQARPPRRTSQPKASRPAKEPKPVKWWLGNGR